MKPYLNLYKALTAESFLSMASILSSPEISCNPEKLSHYQAEEKKEFLKMAEKHLEAIWDDIEKTRKLHLNTSFYIHKYETYLSKTKTLYPSYKSKSEGKLENYKKEADLRAEERRESCTSVMNLKAPLSIEEPRSQTPLGWCYAFALSDLITHKTNINPSPIYTALLTNDQFLYKLFSINEGGFFKNSWDQIQKLGYCDDKFSIEIIKAIQAHNETQQDCNSVALANALPINMNSPLMPLKLFLERNSSEKLKVIADQICPIIKKDSTISALKLQQFFFNPSIKHTDRVKNQQGQLWLKIDQELNAGNILGISLASDLLLSSRTKYNTGIDHAMTIVGRRFNSKNNSCEYLYRDSSGKSCFGYNFIDYQCDNGHIGIPEDVAKARAAVTGIFYFK